MQRWYVWPLFGAIAIAVALPACSSMVVDTDPPPDTETTVVIGGETFTMEPDTITTWKEIEVSEDRIEVDALGAALFRLHPGDTINNGVRAEIREELLPSRLPTNEWVYFDMVIQLPPDWEATRWQEPTADAVILQTKNGDGSPYTSLHLSPAEGFSIRIHNDPVEKWYSPALTGANHILIAVMFSRDGRGRLVALHNEIEFADYSGQTLHPSATHFFSKYGLYRPQWNDEAFDPDRSLLLQYDSFEQGRLR